MNELWNNTTKNKQYDDIHREKGKIKKMNLNV